MKRWWTLVTVYFSLLWLSCACDSDNVVASMSIGPNSIPPSQERKSDDSPSNVNIPHDDLSSDNTEKISSNSETNKKETVEQSNIKIPKFNDSIRKARRKENNDLLDKRKAELSSSEESISDVAHVTEAETKIPKNTELKENPVQKEAIVLDASMAVPEHSESDKTAFATEDASPQFSSPTVEEVQKVKQKLSPSTTTESSEHAVQGQLHHSEAMPSFDEWKKMMLAEQQKGGHKVPIPGLPGKKPPSQKRRRNYASYQCGAKIVAANPEAEGASRILNELVDEYMLNPCQAKIWFVMELCESVQASQIELANFELFSSCIKDFTVYSSDNFPTRDWILLGSFTAAEQRVLQSFPLQQEGFGKFIKIEIQSHYGKEHYCPLSLVHFFGTSMVDEYEELETPSDHLTLNDDELDRLDLPVEDKGSTNLLGSATDAVFNMIKKAAQVLSPNQAAEGEADATVEQNVSESGRCKLDEDKCEEKVKSEKLDSSNIPTNEFLVSAGSIHRTLFRHMKHCRQCVKDTRQSYYSVSEPECRFLQAALGPVLFTSICDWFRDHHLETLHHVPYVKDGNNYSNTSHKPTSPPPSVIQVIIEGSSAEKTSLPALQDVGPTEKVQTFTTEVKESSPESKPTLSTSTSTELLKESEIVPTKTLTRTEVQANASDTMTSSSLIPDPISVLNIEEQLVSETIEPPGSPSVYEFVDSSEMLSSSFMPVPSVEFVSPSSDINEIASIADESISNDSDVLFVESLTIATSTVEIDELTDSLKTIDDSTVKIESIASGGTLSSASQKESVFVRMNNRIKALELNMSLSSQYLQELSQRYRRQMEEMQRAFNRTIGTLNDTAKKAAERDLKQQDIIGILQSQLANLTSVVESLMQERASLETRITERHLCIVLAELIFIVTTVSLCVRRISSLAETITRAHSEAAAPAVSPAGRKRHSSADAPTPPRVAKVKRRSSSEEIIPLDPQGSASSMPPPPPPPPPPKAKKRNRKKKGLQRSASNPSMSPSKCATNIEKDASQEKQQSAAGIIFSHADAKRTSKELHHICENCNKTQTAICDQRKHVNTTENKRKGETPFKNLTNGHVHNSSLNKLDFVKRRDKFSFKKFLRLQKRESI